MALNLDKMSPPPATYHPKAFSGFSNAKNYDAHRPTYIPAAVDGFISALGLRGKREAKILEIGSGTGKFTMIIAGREERFDTIAVEPHEDMTRVLLAKNLPGTTVVKADIHELTEKDVPMDWADAVICSQSFHWFADHDALRQMYSRLKPGGKLGLIWNIEDYNQTKAAKTRTEWEGQMRDVLWEYEDGAQRYKNEKWRDAFKDQTWFGPLQETSVGVTTWIGKEKLWHRIGTMSYISNLYDAEKREFRKKFDSIIDNAQDLVRNEYGEIEIHYDVISAVAPKI